LHDYYRLLAVLEQELQRTSPSASNAAARSALKPSNLLRRNNSKGAPFTSFCCYSSQLNPPFFYVYLQELVVNTHVISKTLEMMKVAVA